MLNAIHHVFVLLFGQPQRIDFWLLGADLLIVALIVCLDVPEKFHKKRVGKRVVLLFDYINRGQLLQAGSPQGIFGPKGPHGESIVPAWIESVKQWNQETYAFLEACSPQARAAFLSDTTDGAAHYTTSLTLPPQAQGWYRTMLTRLDNLRKIAETPEVYF